MATSKTKVVQYKRVRTKNGKTKLMKTGKEIVKNTNVSKGANTGGKPWGSDKAALQSERITESNRTARANRAALSVDVANVANAARGMTKDLAGNALQSTEQQQQSGSNVNPGVDQNVGGGLQESGNSRDEDKDEYSDEFYVM